MNILLVFPGFIIAFAILFYYEYKIRQIRRTEPKNENKVHFYVARDLYSYVYLYLGKPTRGDFRFNSAVKGKCIVSEQDFKDFNLDIKDFKDLKWEDDPVEVFLNLED